MSVRILDVRKAKKSVIFLVEGADWRPEGGGQPGDSGTISWSGGSASVSNTRKAEGDLLYLDVSALSGSVDVGSEVVLQRDEGRRLLLSRMHSAEHVLSRVMENSRPGLGVYKVAVGEEFTTVFFWCEEEIDWDFLLDAEDRARKIIDAQMPIEILELSKDEAKAMPGLKARWDRVTDATIRVVRIPDFDLNACSGSHVSNTGEIGTISIESFKGTAPEWEVTFSISGERDRDLAREMRQIISKLHCRPEEIVKLVERLGAENATFKKQLQKLQAYVSLPWEERFAGEIPCDVLHVVGLPRELVTSEARKRIQETQGHLVLAIADDGESEAVPFVLCWGGSLDVDVSALLKCEALGLRGGGKGGILSGQTRCRSLDTWMKACADACS